MEEWITLSHNKYSYGKTIVAYSNMGRIKRLDGSIEESNYRTRINGERIYRLIASHFLITIKNNSQICIDHITHNPMGMNINDVRNLRWCTQKENMNFDEARNNISKSKKGKPTWNTGMRGAAYTSHYKDGVKNQFSTKVG